MPEDPMVTIHALQLLRELGDTIDSDRKHQLRSDTVRSAIDLVRYIPTTPSDKTPEWLCSNPDTNEAEAIVRRALDLPGFVWADRGGWRDVTSFSGPFADFFECNALARDGGLGRAMFGAPRGTRVEAATPGRQPRIGMNAYRMSHAQFLVPSTFDLDRFVAFLKGHPDEETRREAASVIAEFGDGSHVPLLGELLLDPKSDDRLRGVLCGVLADLGGPEAERLLWQCARNIALSSDLRIDALCGMLDLLTPHGWETYQMSVGRVALPLDARRELEALLDTDLRDAVDNALGCFDTSSESSAEP